jgi:hypothetical protein
MNRPREQSHRTNNQVLDEHIHIDFFLLDE